MAEFPGITGITPNPGHGPGSGYTSPDPMQTAQAPMLNTQYSEARLLDMFNILKRESTEYRWIWEREWLRDLFYVANRQWITFHPTRREWVDKRLQKWIPRPVTNKMAETVQAIRTVFQAVNLAVAVRPAGNDPQAVAAAEISSQMAPLIHEEHLMDQVMLEADFWLVATGNACLQINWDKDIRFNKVFIPHEACQACGQTFAPKDIVSAGNRCPNCGGTQLVRATGEGGQPAGDDMSFGRGKTTALSPFEYAFPPNITRFDDLPYIIRLRWRDKHYYEANYPEMIGRLQWEKSPNDRSLQIFKSLALTNDVGTGSQFAYLGAAGAHTVEGVTEYELWLKPTKEFPEGFVMRVAGDTNPVLLQEPNEGIPGPIPFKDIDGNPVFPFCHCQYEHIGGRLYGRSALSPLIQKQDQINQLDSLIQLIVQRNANPAWIIPENAGVENITGEPGLIIKWNVLAANGQGKPERIPGENIPQTLFALREQYIKDIEDLSGAFDIIKGAKPAGVEAFSALQLLVERSQSRFTSVLKGRGEFYRQWYAIALELERQFGPQQRVWSVVSPNRGYTFQQFENAQLQGQVSIQIEDGSNMPRTSLGKRAAVEQANQLRLLDPSDPDQRYALLRNFGLSDLAPALDMHVQAALQMQDQFERWASNPVGQSPLTVKPWFDLQIHLNERIKWLNTDRMREILMQNPALEPIIVAHLQMLQMGLLPPGTPVGAPGGPAPMGPPQPMMASGPMNMNASRGAGGGQAMTNSNKAGSTSDHPKGNREWGPDVGPA